MKMRIAVVLALLLGLSATPGFAQGLTARGFKIGLNMSNVHFDDQSDATDSKMGLVAGGFFRFGVTDMLAVQPEVLFSMKGAIDDTLIRDTKLIIDYLEIPVLIHVAVPTGGRVRPFVVVGPALAFKVRAKATVDGKEEGDFNEDVKGADIGLVLGGGVEVGGLTVEARYNLGLMNINAEDDENVKNRVFSVLVGFGI